MSSASVPAIRSSDAIVTGSLAASGIDEVWRFFAPHHQAPPREGVFFDEADNRVRYL